MPASRSTRKGIKLGKTAAAAEYRLREEMGMNVGRDSDETYVTPAQRQRNIEQRAALRASFAGLSRAERRRQAEDYKHRLRPLCMSHRAFVGAWTGNFEPLLNGEEAAASRTEAVKSPRPSVTPRTSSPSPSRPAAKSTKSATPASKPSTGSSKGKKKLASDGNMHVAAVEALLRELDADALESLKRAVGKIATSPPPGTHKAVKAGVALIERALAAERRSRS